MIVPVVVEVDIVVGTARWVSMKCPNGKDDKRDIPAVTVVIAVAVLVVERVAVLVLEAEPDPAVVLDPT